MPAVFPPLPPQYAVNSREAFQDVALVCREWLRAIEGDGRAPQGISPPQPHGIQATQPPVFLSSLPGATTPSPSDMIALQDPGPPQGSHV